MNAFGISVAPEEFQRIIDENLGGLESIKATVDDILIWGEDDSSEEAKLAITRNCLPCMTSMLKAKTRLLQMP